MFPSKMYPIQPSFSKQREFMQPNILWIRLEDASLGLVAQGQSGPTGLLLLNSCIETASQIDWFVKVCLSVHVWALYFHQVREKVP